MFVSHVLSGLHVEAEGKHEMVPLNISTEHTLITIMDSW